MFLLFIFFERVKWLIGVIKDFFQMLTSSGDYYADDDSDADYDYDINDI